jgi:hypothetical protein
MHDFRIELLGECGEASHIGEEDGELAALPFKGTARG